MFREMNKLKISSCFDNLWSLNDLITSYFQNNQTKKAREINSSQQFYQTKVSNYYNRQHLTFYKDIRITKHNNPDCVTPDIQNNY
jgi:hypothetical protein